MLYFLLILRISDIKNRSARWKITIVGYIEHEIGTHSWTSSEGIVLFCEEEISDDANKTDFKIGCHTYFQCKRFPVIIVPHSPCIVFNAIHPPILSRREIIPLSNFEIDFLQSRRNSVHGAEISNYSTPKQSSAFFNALGTFILLKTKYEFEIVEWRNCAHSLFIDSVIAVGMSVLYCRSNYMMSERFERDEKTVSPKRGLAPRFDSSRAPRKQFEVAIIGNLATD